MYGSQTQDNFPVSVDRAFHPPDYVAESRIVGTLYAILLDHM